MKGIRKFKPSYSYWIHSLATLLNILTIRINRNFFMHAITLESCRFSLFLFYTMEIRYSYNIHCFHEIVHFSQLYDVTATSKTVSISMWIAFPPMIMKIKSIPVHESFSMWQYIVWEMNSLNVYTWMIIRISDKWYSAIML